ncbi:putative defense protein 3 [Mercenaria mercenaria]|uniref:putative defense protein 3 n=1 Tax=Mercenaria mercenaria TaxID=6596 RepID=UPI00234EE546|nr:putative defense protein 3 [Mercenaria mercenaria]
MKTAIASCCLVMITVMLGVRGYPTGAPPEGCSTMLPGHGVPAQTGTTNPYKILTDKSTFSCPGDSITVSVSGNSLRGFLCQPIPNTGELEQNPRDPVQKQNKCGQMASLTHVDNTIKSSISFFWKPETTQSVNIVCTVVQSKLMFWVNVSSTTLRYVKGNCQRPTPGQEIPEHGGSDAGKRGGEVIDSVERVSADTGLDRTPDAGTNMVDSRRDQLPDTSMDNRLDIGVKDRDAINDPDAPGRDLTDTKDRDGKNVGHRSSGMIALVVLLVLSNMVW